MKYIRVLLLILFMTSTASAGGMTVAYDVGGQPYEGYFVSPSSKAFSCGTTPRRFLISRAATAGSWPKTSSSPPVLITTP